MTMDLQIVTPDGVAFGGPAQRVLCRTIGGDVCILPRHANYCTPLGMGEASILADGKERKAACIGGLLSVHDGEVTLVPTTFEWAEDIDLPRAEAAYEKGQELLENSKSDADIKLAQARIHRALVRKSVASGKLNGDMQK